MVTPLYIALSALFLIFLSFYVITARREFRVTLGDDGHHELQRRIRAQQNFLEYTPLFLMLLASLELLQCPAYGIHLLGSFFLFSRLSHAYGVTKAEKKENDEFLNLHFRVKGMIGTFITLGISAVLVIILTIIKLVIMN